MSTLEALRPSEGTKPGSFLSELAVKPERHCFHGFAVGASVAH